jgi:thiosulfate dehydrogenase [quinone] large subunit
MPNDDSSSDFSLAHLLLRLGLGVNFFVHGLSRLPNLAGFVAYLEQTMAKTWLPLPLVTAAGFVIPFVELITGVLLILGLFLRPALVLGSLFMIALTFGICLAQNWTVAAEQLIYLLVFALLLATARRDRYSLDSWRVG